MQLCRIAQVLWQIMRDFNELFLPLYVHGSCFISSNVVALSTMVDTCQLLHFGTSSSRLHGLKAIKELIELLKGLKKLWLM